MLSQGLSHVTLNANNTETFESSLKFYTSLGFKVVSEKTEADQRVAWISLQSSCSNATDASIQLVQNVSAFSVCRPAGDIDWSLEGHSIAFAVSDVKAIQSKLQELDAPVQDHSADDFIKIYTLDPLNNIVVFTNKCVKATSAAAAVEAATTNRKKIAVLTSGGDAPGMNPVVRAVVRYGIAKGCDIFAVYEGYQGIGGTTIGTARCMPFKTREGRLKGAENLVKNGIDSLIVCGGDGSLTGADLFRAEWSGLLEELKNTNRITAEEHDAYKFLTIVGLVGSIDNDMSSTDITIGAVTSLHRICESVDAVSTTALSHSRAFVIEVMGRHCGWLALMTGIATGADFIFIPEKPPAEDDWETSMCSVVERHRHLGKRKTVVIVAEGAIDKNLNPIKAEHLKNILTDRLGLDTRVTILGHTQRGGPPAFFDRLLATTQSIEAVDAVLESTPTTPSPMIGMVDNVVVRYPLMEAVKLTHEVAEAIGQKNFARAMELRDPQFAEEYDAYNATTILDDDSIVLPEYQRLRIAVVHMGAPAGGMNAATRTAVRYCLNRGHTPLAVNNGFVGFSHGSLKEMSWMSVDGWTALGGSELGTNRAVPGEDVDMGMITYQIQKNQIQGILLVGGFEAFAAIKNLEAARAQYPSLRIPIVLIPATISNNVPGTDYSLGSDTSLNSIVNACDAIVQSAQSSRRRVFVVEVMGGHSGYLAVEAGLAIGANTVYIPEEGINLHRLEADINHLKAMYNDDDPDRAEGRIILRTEDVSTTYTTEVISNILKDEGENMFDSRTAVLGHIQQGVTPSPLDRIRATRLAMRSIQFVEEHTTEALNRAKQTNQPVPVELTNETQSVSVVGISGHLVTFSPVTELIPQTDMKNRTPRKNWWYEHRTIVDLLAGRGFFKCP
ncbi:6-phosphofructokinase [Backusella circina FSU 941]|nr:6-phosphofructokinase [Backusella circina FSU 941]